MGRRTSAMGRPTRTVLAYRHEMLRDVVVPQLLRAGVKVIGSYPDQDFTVDLLRGLQPDVILIDQAAERAVSECVQAALSPQASAGAPSRVMTIDLTNNALTVWCRRLVPRFTVYDLVQAVNGESADSRQPRSPAPGGDCSK